MFRYVVVILLFFTSCDAYHRMETLNGIRDIPFRHLESYDFSEQSPIRERIKNAPPFVLTYLRELDSRNNYEPFPVDENVKMEMERIVGELPVGMRQMLQQRLVGVYFVKDFLSSGMTEWLVDEQGNIFAFVVLHPRLLDESASEIITYRENTAFVTPEESEKGAGVQIRLNPDPGGLRYLIYHEFTHVLDLVKKVTPYVESGVRYIQKNDPAMPEISVGIWDGYRDVVGKHDFSLRDQASFYGLRKGPHLRYEQAKELYDGLSRSPFVSLYGSMSQAEDFAELFTYYLLQEKYHLDYTIRWNDGKGNSDVVRPLSGDGLKQRRELLNQLVHALN